MNKKGFTLTELLAVIIILGVISMVAVPSFMRYINGSSDRYYTSLESNLESTTKEYMAENTNYYPKNNGDTNSIKGTNLINAGLIEKITDDKGNDCSASSYVIVKKDSKGKYTYTACLVCGSYKSSDSSCNQ